MSTSSFMSVPRERLIGILQDTPEGEVILVEKGVPYTAAQVLVAVEHSAPGTVFHIPKPKE